MPSAVCLQALLFNAMALALYLCLARTAAPETRHRAGSWLAAQSPPVAHLGSSSQGVHAHRSVRHRTRHSCGLIGVADALQRDRAGPVADVEGASPVPVQMWKG